MTEAHKVRFPVPWGIFTGEVDEFAGQTRLETVRWIDPGRVIELRKNDIHTVEKLAAVSDGALSQLGIMDLRRFRDKAIEYVKRTVKPAEADALRAENAELKERIAAQEERFAALEARLGAPAAPSAGGVRPRTRSRRNPTWREPQTRCPSRRTSRRQ